MLLHCITCVHTPTQVGHNLPAQHTARSVKAYVANPIHVKHFKLLAVGSGRSVQFGQDRNKLWHSFIDDFLQLRVHVLLCTAQHSVSFGSSPSKSSRLPTSSTNLALANKSLWSTCAHTHAYIIYIMDMLHCLVLNIYISRVSKHKQVASISAPLRRATILNAAGHSGLEHEKYPKSLFSCKLCKPTAGRFQ